MELKDTLNLPVTAFPMRANLTAREPARIEFWEKTELYKRLQEKNAGTGKTFVLHDGPPFTNGDVHIGTALNKLLKEIIMRYKTMRGYRTPYIPGWDCHGLPIEHKVMKGLKAASSTPAAFAAVPPSPQGEGLSDRKVIGTTGPLASPLEIRKACAEFSEKFIEKQRSQFRRLGILADWAAEYKTKNPAYEADVVRTFANMVERGLIYRSKKPVYWSIPCKTALAEAEIEYKAHTSDSIWVAFEEVAKTQPHLLPAPAKPPTSFPLRGSFSSSLRDDETKHHSTGVEGGNMCREGIEDGKSDGSSESSDAVIPKPASQASPLSRGSDVRLHQAKQTPEASEACAQANASGAGAPRYFVIWTTTPWTIPANMAVAVHPDLEYVEISHNGKTYIVAAALAENFIKDCDLSGATFGTRHLGKTLEGIETKHPICDRISPIVLADYITTDAGTGCVHTAGGHGLEDYQTCNKYGIEIYCPVNDDGVYADDGRVPKELVGVSVLDTNGKCPANEMVLRLLKESGKLLKTSKLEHQYPHCWRSKTPVIFRAMDQWFVALDKDGLRASALEQIGKVTWIPASGENRIRAAVEGRPDWCISRQRSWGIPIPVFYHADTHEPFLDAGVVRALADKIAVSGTDLWFEKSPVELLEGIALPAGWPVPEKLVKGMDTLDVWIDSGSSSAAVLKRRPELTFPADLYLEGSDQHRGWFQSSLWTSVINFNEAPYKTVLTHGFVVNEGTRQKISKSDGKPQTADGYVSKYGADIVRLWVASENYQNDVPLSDGILDATATQYRNIRNTIRYQLSNLYDFDVAKDAVALDKLTLIDKWALGKLDALVKEVERNYENWEFHKAYAAIDAFTVQTLSATYHNILKDRLYTFAPDSHERRSSQTAIRIILETYLKILAPMLPFTTDEAWGHFTKPTASAGIHTTADCGRAKARAISVVPSLKKGERVGLCPTPQKGENGEREKRPVAGATDETPCHSVLLEDWPELPPELEFKEEVEEFDGLLKVLDAVNLKLDALRSAKVIGQSLDAVVEISGDPASAEFALLKKHEAILPETFIVSDVKLMALPRPSPKTGEGDDDTVAGCRLRSVIPNSTASDSSTVAMRRSPSSGSEEELAAGSALSVEAVKAESMGYKKCLRSWRWVPELVSTPFGGISPRCAEVLKAKGLI